jgi:hypothetical protein
MATGKEDVTMTVPQQLPDLRLQGLLVDERAATLVDDLLWQGKNVLLTPTWIAQAQKADSQRMLMAVERDTLWPMARQLMADLLSVLTDDQARIWAGTALALLDEKDGAGAVRERVGKVLKDPASTPRGHYEEGMHGYFRGLQFLLKSVFDVGLNQTRSRAISHFVFPWSGLGNVLEALRAHPDLRQRWEDLHSFYTVATGEPDCVSICHLLDLPQVRPETVSALAQELGLPRINRRMGIGVQGLAERFTRHGVVFERLKETFLPDVAPTPIPRESVYAVVNMHSLLYGFEHHGGRIPTLLDGKAGGLLEALASVRQQPVTSFFDQFLMAQYELVADLPVPEVTALVPSLDPAVEQLSPSLRRRLNAFAANLTSLLELSIMSAKQPLKAVVVGIGLRSPAPPRKRVYVEAAPRAFFERLSQAGQTVVKLCQQITDKYGTYLEDRLPPPDGSLTLVPTPRPLSHRDMTDASRGPAIYDLLADLSEGGRFILRGSPQWHTIAPLVGTLARNVNVTADAYRYWDLDRNEQYFLQWCMAMASFKARLADGARVQGGELLFVEGWNDAIVPGRREPLTNSVWRDILGQITLEDLKDRAIAPGLSTRRLQLFSLRSLRRKLVLGGPSQTPKR